MTDTQSLPVVLLSGWGMPATLLEGLIPEAMRTRALVPGEPGVAPGETALDWLERTLPSLPERALWFGWSLGGQLAMEAASRWPERVAGVVTMASTPRFVGSSDWPHGMAQVDYDGFSAQLQEGASTTLERFRKLMVQGDERLKEVRRSLRATTEGVGVDGTTLAVTLEWLGRLDQRQLWCQRPVATLHLFGERDPLVSAATPRELGLDPGCWEVVAGMAHWPGGPRADEIRSPIDEFRKQLT